MKRLQAGGMPSTAVRNGCRSSVAALGRELGAFTRQQATKSLNSSEKEPSSTGAGFCRQEERNRKEKDTKNRLSNYVHVMIL